MKTITAKIPADAWDTLVKLVPQYAAYAIVPKLRKPKIGLSRVGWEPSGKFLTVERETLEAYADSWDEANGYERRNLAFKASHSVSVVEAMDIMKSACPDGHNEFTHKALQYLPLDAEIILAREGSPCVYVLGPEFEQTNRMLADEFNFYPNEYRKTYGENQFTIPGPCTRIWWD